MAVRSAVLTPDDQEYYPLHEEDDVPEVPPHRRWVDYLYDVFSTRSPDWFVTGNVCIYWERENMQQYRAPDIFVVKEPLNEAVHRVYLTWKQPPVAFVAEIGSRSSVREDEGPKVEVYQDHVRAGEYYYADPPHGHHRLWRLGRGGGMSRKQEPSRPRGARSGGAGPRDEAGGGYVEAQPEANGRLRSEALGLEFALEEGELRLYTLEGELLLSHVETAAAWREAEAARQEEVRRRETAEAERAEAQARAAELERQLAELRARMGES